MQFKTTIFRSTIFALNKNYTWEVIPAWHNTIAPDWHTYSNTQIAAILAALHPLTLQAPDKHNQYKLSYYAPVDTNLERL
jgi:sucrose-6-phosphatase